MRFGAASGHGFNCAEQVPPEQWLQPLWAKDTPQGLKPSALRFIIGTTKVVP
jgi:hypothetical protein